MEVKDAVFVMSNQDYNKCPAPNIPEVAFIGRSNVGKSSLINMICNNKKLAKTSSAPGKTQLINHFNINNNWYLVDLPGYGYAKVSKKMRAVFEKMIHEYLQNRPNLLTTFVLIDSRIPPQKLDLEFINLLGEWGIPLSIVYTKTDKVKTVELQKNWAAFKKELKNNWDEMPPFFFTSSAKPKGKDDLLNYIDEIIPLFEY